MSNLSNLHKTVLNTPRAVFLSLKITDERGCVAMG
nr:MAG TPA: hypothetical protein [Caudoviricetes sp.]DAR78983.1 MAG TPA: hypothetical protein [Caudoviricetes sp.]